MLACGHPCSIFGLVLSENIRFPCFDASMERFHFCMKAPEFLIRLRYASWRLVGRSPSGNSNTYFIFIMSEQIKSNQIKAFMKYLLAGLLAYFFARLLVRSSSRLLKCLFVGLLVCLLVCLLVFLLVCLLVCLLLTCLPAYLSVCLLSRPKDPICFFKCDCGSKEITTFSVVLVSVSPSAQVLHKIFFSM